MTRAVLLPGEVFGMRLGKALEQAEVARAVAQRYLLRAHPQAYPGEALHQIALLVVLGLAEPVGPSPVVPLAHGEVGRRPPVDFGHLYVIQLRHDLAKLSGEVEANAGVVLEERIYAVKRGAFTSLKVFHGIGLAVTPRDANLGRAVRRAFDLRPELVAPEGRDVEPGGAA